MATNTKTTGGAESKGKGHESPGPGNRAAKSRSKTQVAAPGGVDRAYLTLIRRFPLRPIRTDTELAAASEMIDELTVRDDLGSTEADYLDVLGDLVEKY